MIRPRRLVHRGSVLAAAYVLEASKRAEVLRRWRPGHELFTLGDRIFWQLPEPERVQADAAPGLPLVALDRRLLGLPLEPDELAAAPASGILLAEAGVLTPRALGPSIDPSTWLDVTAFTFAEKPTSLGDPPAPPALGFVPRPATDARTALGMSPLSQEAAAVAESLRTGRPLPPSEPAPQPIAIGPLARGLINVLRRISRALTPAAAPNALARREPSWLARFDAWLGRVLDATPLANVLGQRQADYLNRLMDMFERGDLDAALRHAIPLGGQAAGQSAPSASVPTPRSTLDISLHSPATPAPSMRMHHDAYEELRRRYRAAAQKLEAEGRYQEAAFVLAELLHADEEAVALLERHQKYTLAAELAESRQLAPGLQVRQWFLAKNVPRAVAVARRHGVFSDAVARLTRSKHETEAKQLRLIWADSQATNGDFYNAVLTLWPLEDTRPLARRWIALGIAQGGHAAARLKVKRLALGGGVADSDVTEVLADLDSDDPERAVDRALITAELETESPHLAGIARPLARAALRTSMRDGAVPPAHRLALLKRLAADGALEADMPGYPTSEVKLSVRAPPVRHDIEAWDRGTLPIEDAALGPDGRMLVALGEAGVRQLTRDGRTARHYEVPAESLVPFDHGGHALAVARRGDVVVIHKLDLVHGGVEPLPQLQLASWADGTDGSVWFAWQGGALLALDLHDAKLRALWRVPLQHLAQRPSRNALSLSLHVTPAPDTREWWRYELPSMTLRARQTVALPPVHERVFILPDGNTCITHGGIAWQQATASQARRQMTGLAGGPIDQVSGAGDWFSLVTRGEGGQRWMLVDTFAVTVRHVVQLPSCSYRVRMRPDLATYFDAAGRVLVVDLQTGRLLRDLRIR